ncbi:Acryloyl-CoA reductase (NADH) [Sinobacterium norvegicum]|uniref:Acryloyl-CoA reductase (NADH) n=1 Tax=Sinobacterium norvegicum TaxID=1641715 RepID=A0ABN8EL17_9GAMM|nr:acyl-CoA dehydrogenase [Sinobacterium norvegicum]CAH0993095.1 Acryloyl-CoA reductase (NADH) [Sinobacterium norvegicum]
MDFSLSEEQVLLKDSIDKFVRENNDAERHRKLSKSAQGFDPETWQLFADLGWLSVPFAEEQGGFGGSAADVMVVCEALGKGLTREPFLSTVITCGGFLRLAGSSAQQEHYIPKIIDGSEQWAFAFAEDGSGYDMSAITTVAVQDADGYVLTGSKIAVLNGHCANHLVVTARLNADDPESLSLFIVDTTAAGIRLESFAAVDSSKGAVIHFEGVRLSADQLLGTAGQSLALIEQVIDESIVAMGGEALAAMQKLLDSTVEYTGIRQQFGQPIGKFQVLQHRMADMYLKVEETRSLLFNAAIKLTEGNEDAALACAALKVKLAEAGRYVSQQAVQLHGAVGMTDELDVSHYYKRLLVLGMLYGDEKYYLQQYTKRQQSMA